MKKLILQTTILTASLYLAYKLTISIILNIA